jgi:hypothetical protein
MAIRQLRESNPLKAGPWYAFSVFAFGAFFNLAESPVEATVLGDSHDVVNRVT